ncbi:Mitochondrial distribution and morphology protein 12 [Candida viswanathii]|uniref:Mitochondrial distribution and morphology protein 12 n=1 Tax=Candida viswanathii TaxID=5486 RepID=A0A367YKJ6_9ASCO|nr:Mitochondrial distribution and morphology protein 12 [Candida viswanathii]
MSFDINWENLTVDNTINAAIQDFLDEQFKKLSLPSYISNLSVTDFQLGEIPPEITIRHIGDPFDEFYEDTASNPEAEQPKPEPPAEDEDESDEDESDSNGEEAEDEGPALSTISEGIHLLNFNRTGSPVPDAAPLSPRPMNRSRDSFQSILHPFGVNIGPTGSETPTNLLNQNYFSSRRLPKISSKQRQPLYDENDIQLIVEFNYKGNLHMNILVNLLVNYPSPNFISLPIKLHITDIEIHSIATVAYLKKSVFLSFLCDVNDETIPEFNNNSQSTGENFIEYYANNNNRERIDIIKRIKIESEIGEIESNILRNVGKVEKFLVEQLRNILREEIAWPSWICLDMNEEEEEEEQEEVHLESSSFTHVDNSVSSHT